MTKFNFTAYEPSTSKRSFKRTNLTSKQKARVKIQEEVAQFLLNKGYRKDKWHNYKKQGSTNVYRYKFAANVLRYETKIKDRWMLIRSGFWKNLQIENGKIKGWK